MLVLSIAVEALKMVARAKKKKKKNVIRENLFIVV